MLILVIADIHDNLPNLTKCLNWAKKQGVRQLICAGDVTNGETLEFLAANFAGEIFLIRGNMDLYDESEANHFANIKYLGRYGVTAVDGLKVGICHEPFFREKVLEIDAKVKFIFYGHTHKPWLEDADGRLEINPGTLGAVFQKATFATWETTTGRVELKILELL